MSLKYNVIIFTGIKTGDLLFFRSIGAYRIRTELESHGYSVKVIDYFQYLSQFEIELAIKKYISSETLWIGLSTTFFDTEKIDSSSKFYHRIKEQYNVKIVMGGAKARAGNFDFADYFLTGHSDNAVIELTNALSKNIPIDNNIFNGNDELYDRKDLSKIDVVWKPEDHIQKYTTLPIELSRGCIFKCAFCQYPFTGKKKFDYVRDKNNIREEFIRNYEQFGVTSYQFVDDTYNDSMEKLEYMYKLITDLPFKIRFDAYIKPELLVRWPEQADLLIESGIRGASFGIESLNRKTRSSIQKMPEVDRILSSILDLKNKSYGVVKTQANLIVGLPYESEESVFKTQEFFMNCEYIDFWIWWPLQIWSGVGSEYSSPIEKDPNSFGYEISIPMNIQTNIYNKVLPKSVYWKNDHFDITRATELAKSFNEEAKPKLKLGGWLTGAVQSSGIDVDEHYKNFGGYIHTLPHQEIKKRIEKSVHQYIEENILT